MKARIWPLAVALAFIFCACQQTEKAEKVFINGHIWTGNPLQPWATCIGVKGDRILFVGDKYQHWCNAATSIIDLQEKLVTPGFIDNHVHFLSGGFQLASVDLRSAATPKEFTRRLADFARQLPEDRWITGGDWDHEAWGGELPRREWIDSVSNNHPVFVSRLDGHMALANTAALRLAGIDRNTADPAGGTIVRDPATGEPTGILKDEAMSLVFSVMPDPGNDELDEALDRAVSHALSLGVTQIHDVSSMGGWIDLETYKRAYATDRLKLRIYSFVPIADWQRMAEYVRNNGRGDNMLRWGALKGFVDGSLGSTTAWFYQPYNDAPNTTGLLVTDSTALRKWIIDADAAGLQIGVHAIGDRANDWLLGVFAEAVRTNGTRDRRFRIEHAQHLTAEAIPKFAAQGVIPSMQPYHAIDDGRWAEKRIGKKRCKTTYAFNSLLKAGAQLTFGSDWTVAPINPLEGIYAAVTRQTLDGKNPNGWYPEEKITVAQALECYTSHNAFAGFQEKDLGTLQPGKLADFVVLSANIFEIPPPEIRNVKVLRTVVGGVDRYSDLGSN